MAWAKIGKKVGNFQVSYSKSSGRPTHSAKTIQSAMPASLSNYSRTPSPNFQNSKMASL